MYTSTSNISTQCQNVRLDCRAHFRIIYVANQTQYRSGKVRFVTLDIVPKCPLCQTMLIDGCDKINIATKSRLYNAQRVTASRQRDQMSNYAASGYLGRICRLVCHNNPALECPAGYQWPFCKNWKIEQSMRNRISSSKVRLHQKDAVKSRCGGRHCEYNELLARDCPGDRGRRANSSVGQGYQTQLNHTGRWGRSSFDITREKLSFLLEQGFKVKECSNLLGVEQWNIEKRMSSFGLSVSGERYSVLFYNFDCILHRNIFLLM